jgi:hypothetical protein
MWQHAGVTQVHIGHTWVDCGPADRIRGGGDKFHIKFLIVLSSKIS